MNNPLLTPKKFKEILYHSLLKWCKTINISFSKLSAYRFNFILTFLAPAFVTFFIKYHLWSAIYKGHPSGEINGYNLQEMIHYHIWALVISLMAKGHSALDLALEIRHGKISSYLIYPFNFWEFHTASFLAFEMVQISIALTTVAILSSTQLISFPSLSVLALGLIYCLLVSFFWFSLQFFTGILAFWLEETWMLRALIQTIVTFLSGSIIPLEFFPSWLASLLSYTPFPFMIYYPIKIFTGQNIAWDKGAIVISLWTIFMIIVNTLTWRKGVRLYTAAGM